jgi:transcriptional regulator with XRE-family HTH domain
MSYSREELAERCGLRRTYIGHVERGKVSVTLDSIVRIASGLQVDPGELLRDIAGGRSN